MRDFLADFAARYPADEVLAPLRAAEDLRVLVVGETIIDEYTYCEAIGKSGKEPVLATRFLGTDRFGGGVLACANHAASFCEQVDVFTQLGEGGDEEQFVRSVLKSNVTPIFVEKKNSPTIVKKRFVEKYLSQKLFEVYRMNDAPLDERGRRRALRPAARDAAANTTSSSSPTTATACSLRTRSMCSAARRSSWPSTRSRTPGITAST